MQCDLTKRVVDSENIFSLFSLFRFSDRLIDLYKVRQNFFFKTSFSKTFLHASNFSLSQNRGIYFVLGIFGTQLKKFFILRQKTTDFVTLTEEILIGKLYLLYSVTDMFCFLNKMFCRLSPSWRQPKNL